MHASLKDFECGLQKNDPEISPSQIYAYAALKMRRAVRQRRAAHDHRHAGAARTGARACNVPVAGKDYKSGQTFMKTLIAPGLKSRLLGLQRLVLHQYSGQPRWRSAGRAGLVPLQGSQQVVGARIHSAEGSLSRSVQGVLPQGPHRVLSAARRRQGRLGQHRHLRLAGLPHADQDQLPVPRFHSGRAAGAGYRAVHGPGAARRHARHSGVAVVLFQGAHACPRSCTPSTTSSSSS